MNKTLSARTAAEVLPPPEPGQVRADVFTPVMQKLTLANVQDGLAEQMVVYLVGRWNGLMLAAIRKHVPDEQSARRLLYRLNPADIHLDHADALGLQKEIPIVMAQVAHEIELRLPFMEAWADANRVDPLNN
jgi:hypothetical protein